MKRKKPRKKNASRKTLLKNLRRAGDTIVLDQRCVSTASGVAADYPELHWDARKMMQYVSQKKQNSAATITPGEIKRVFAGSALVGDEKRAYATDAEIQELIDKPGQSPSKFAVNLMAKRLELTPSTVLTYTKRRKKSKAQI